MIRIRKADGSVITVPPDGHFVELVNDVDETVQMVLFQPSPGKILQVFPGSADAARYEAMFAQFGVSFTPRMITRR